MTLAQRREILVAYLRMKTEEQDWHGVADAAMDLRELDVELRAVLTKPTKVMGNA